MSLSEDSLTFEDGILFCKHIYQCAIHKTLNGLPEQWDIFFKTQEKLQKFEHPKKNERLHEILFKLEMEDVYMKM